MATFEIPIFLSPDKELKSWTFLYIERLLYVIMYRSYKLLKTVGCFWPTL